MRIGIIGAGSLGLLIAGYLGKRHEIHLYSRHSSGQSNIETELSVYESGNYRTKTKVIIAAGQFDRELDCYFVCVKQPDIQPLIQQLAQLPCNTSFIFIQNGMGHLDSIKQLKQSVYIGIVEHGAKRIDYFQVDHLGKGKIALAQINNNTAKLRALTKLLDHPDFPFEQAADPIEAMKNKLIINSVINPLTALFNVPNKEIIHNTHIQRLAGELCNEAAIVLELNRDQAWENIKQTAINTGDNTSSMLQDVLMGKGTEIQAISGYLLTKSNNNLPYTTFVYEAILALERKDQTSWGK